MRRINQFFSKFNGSDLVVFLGFMFFIIFVSVFMTIGAMGGYYGG